MFQREFEDTGNIKDFAVWAADFIDNLPVGMYRTTLEGELIFCNWAFVRLLGYDEAHSLQDFQVGELFPRKAERGDFIRHVLDRGKAQQYRMQLLQKNGELLTCSTTARAVLNDDGQVTYIDGVMVSVEETDKAQSDAMGSSSTYDRVSAYMRLDPDGTIENMNEIAVSFFGSSTRSDSEPLSLYSFVFTDHRDKLTGLFDSVRKQEHSLDVIPLMDEKGTMRQMECQASAVYLLDGEYKIDFVCRDVSRTIESLRKSQAEERFQGVQEMAGGIAHNMNQPLTIMNNLVSDLTTNLSGEDSDVQEKLDRIQNQLHKLNLIAEKVRSVKQYKSIHYLLGEKIIDLDQMS
ncbi:MAG: PAS domain-containing protein [Desulfohalobiaceae bacterium]